MMMIGDLSAGKSDMMAKYFGKNPHDMFMDLTESGMIQESKTIECQTRTVKINCLDTTQSSQNPEMFQDLIRGQRGIICAYNPFKRSSWDYIVKELRPILDGKFGKPQDKWIVIGCHMIKGHQNQETEVREKDVYDYCNENNIFHVKVDGGTNKGLREAFEYGPISYILKKENNIESLIFRQLKRTIELQQEKHKYFLKQQKKAEEKFQEVIKGLKERIKQRDDIILNLKEDRRLFDEQFEKIREESDSLKKEMLKI